MDDDGEEYYFYVYKEDEEDPRFGFWTGADSIEFSLFERTPEQGVWLSNEQKSSDEYERRAPTEDFERILGALAAGKKVGVDDINDLPPHEEFFAHSFAGTVQEKGQEAIPNGVLGYAESLIDEPAQQPEEED